MPNPEDATEPSVEKPKGPGTPAQAAADTAQAGKEAQAGVLLVDEETGSKETSSVYEAFWLEQKKPWPRETRQNYLKDGVEFIVQVHENKWGTLVFRDKSARPLAGFFREIWRRLYPHEIPPVMKFMADRGTSAMYQQRFPRADFEGKKVLIVDEQVDTGQGAAQSLDMLRKAFPAMEEARVGALMDFKHAINLASEDIAISMHSPLYKDLTRGEKGVEDVIGQPFVKAKRGINARQTITYALRMVGRYEILDESDVQAVDTQLHESHNVQEKERLSMLREAYTKLTKK